MGAGAALAVIPRVALAVRVAQQIFRERLEMLEVVRWRRYRRNRNVPAADRVTWRGRTFRDDADPGWDNAVRAYEEDR